MVSFVLDRESYYADADELDNAMAEIGKELAENSNSWESWAAEADVLYLCKLYRASAMCCDKALLLNPKDPLAWNANGNAL
jgi:tetratricopeptide (TPR) repeat protein